MSHSSAREPKPRAQIAQPYLDEFFGSSAIGASGIARIQELPMHISS